MRRRASDGAGVVFSLASSCPDGKASSSSSPRCIWQQLLFTAGYCTSLPIASPLSSGRAASASSVEDYHAFSHSSVQIPISLLNVVFLTHLCHKTWSLYTEFHFIFMNLTEKVENLSIQTISCILVLQGQGFHVKTKPRNSLQTSGIEMWLGTDQGKGVKLFLNH